MTRGNSASYLESHGFAGVGVHRNIAAYTESPGSGNGPTTLDGQQNRMAPVNVGYILDGGYLADYAACFCPSAAGMETTAENSADSLENLRQVRACAASTDARSLFLGNYSKLTWFGGSWDANNRGYWRLFVASSYNYRATPYGTGDASMDSTTLVSVGGTKPLAYGHNGGQVFPTQRALGGRALLCDSFEKGHVQNTDSLAAKTKAARYSAGMQAHREGHNVAYGDGHVAWHGDPQGVFIWFECGVTSDYSNMMSTLGFREWVRYPQGGRSGPLVHYRRVDGAAEVWHYLDVAGGVDEDADFRHGPYPN